MRTATIALFAIALMALAPLAQAASSHISIVYDPAGTFEVFLEDTSPGGETNGIVSYGIQLAGSVQAVEHLSPNTSFAQDASFNGGSAGFAFLHRPTTCSW